MNIFKHFHFNTLSSTNDYASELLTAHPLVAVSCDHQTQGRGRNGKSWEGKEGSNVYLSFGINHKSDTICLYPKPYGYQMAGALLALDTLREIGGDAHFRLKYPNDIYVWADGESVSINDSEETADNGEVASTESRKRFGKISGVISEHVFQGSTCTQTVLGIGININQTEFPKLTDNKPISLAQLSGGEHSVDNIVQTLLVKAPDYLFKTQSTIFAKWKMELDIIGEQLFDNGSGKSLTVTNIMDDGRLVCNQANGDPTSGNTQIHLDNTDKIRYGVFNVNL